MVLDCTPDSTEVAGILETAFQRISGLQTALDYVNASDKIGLPETVPSLALVAKVERPNKIFNRLYQVMSLTDLGVTACDDNNTPTVLSQAGCAAQFKVIGALARDVVDILETSETTKTNEVMQ